MTDSNASLVARLQARAEIAEVISATAHSQDDADWQRHAACFWPDAVYRHPGGVIEGVEAIVSRARAALEPLDSRQHMVGSVSIDVAADGTTAQTFAYFHAQHYRAAAAASGGALLVIAGSYADRFECRNGEWRIAERVQAYRWRDGNPQVIIR